MLIRLVRSGIFFFTNLKSTLIRLIRLIELIKKSHVNFVAKVKYEKSKESLASSKTSSLVCECLCTMQHLNAEYLNFTECVFENVRTRKRPINMIWNNKIEL